MAVTPLAPTKRFIREGITKVYFVPTAANYKALTKTELDAGTDLTSEMVEAAGWDVTGNLVDSPDWGSRYTAKVSGLITSSDSSITFYEDKTGKDVRTLLPRDTTGYVVWMDGGEVVGQPMDVYPVTVSSLSKDRATATPAHLVITFAITAQPSEDQAIPAT